MPGTYFLVNKMLSDYLDLFVDEVQVSLEALQELFAALRVRSADRQLLAEAFRIVHSLKSMAGTVECASMVELCHSTEEVLNFVRQKNCSLPTSTQNLLFNCLHHLTNIIEDIRKNLITLPPHALLADIKNELAMLNTLMNSECRDEKPIDEHEVNSVFHRTVKERIRTYRVELVLAYDVINPTVKLRNILETIHDCVGSIQYSSPSLQQLQESIGEEETSLSIATILERATEDSERRLEFTLQLEQSAYGLMLFLQDYCPLESISVEEVNTGEPAKVISSAKNTQIRLDAQSLTEIQVQLSLLSRVHLEVSQLLRRRPFTSNQDAGRGLELAERLENSASTLEGLLERVGFITFESIFKRFPRYLESLAAQRNKRINLLFEGGEIKVDRRLSDSLYEILLQLFRNAIDHGLEEIHERPVRGKTVAGNLKVVATDCHYGWLNVKVSDDGRGLDFESIRNKALSVGIISETDQLTETELANLIFSKGLSTARTVTDTSGRGIGMDIVAERLRELNGHIEVSSRTGMGVEFSLYLPQRWS